MRRAKEPYPRVRTAFSWDPQDGRAIAPAYDGRGSRPPKPRGRLTFGRLASTVPPSLHQLWVAGHRVFSELMREMDSLGDDRKGDRVSACRLASRRLRRIVLAAMDTVAEEEEQELESGAAEHTDVSSTAERLPTSELLSLLSAWWHLCEIMCFGGRRLVGARMASEWLCSHTLDLIDATLVQEVVQRLRSGQNAVRGCDASTAEAALWGFVAQLVLSGQLALAASVVGCLASLRPDASLDTLQQLLHSFPRQGLAVGLSGGTISESSGEVAGQPLDDSVLDPWDICGATADETDRVRDAIRQQEDWERWHAEAAQLADVIAGSSSYHPTLWSLVRVLAGQEGRARSDLDGVETIGAEGTCDVLSLGWQHHVLASLLFTGPLVSQSGSSVARMVQDALNVAPAGPAVEPFLAVCVSILQGDVTAALRAAAEVGESADVGPVAAFPSEMLVGVRTWSAAHLAVLLEEVEALNLPQEWPVWNASLRDHLLLECMRSLARVPALLPAVLDYSRRVHCKSGRVLAESLFTRTPPRSEAEALQWWWFAQDRGFTRAAQSLATSRGWWHARRRQGGQGRAGSCPGWGAAMQWWVRAGAFRCLEGMLDRCAQALWESPDNATWIDTVLDAVCPSPTPGSQPSAQLQAAWKACPRLSHVCAVRDWLLTLEDARVAVEREEEEQQQQQQQQQQEQYGERRSAESAAGVLAAEAARQLHAMLVGGGGAQRVPRGWVLPLLECADRQGLLGRSPVPFSLSMAQDWISLVEEAESEAELRRDATVGQGERDRWEKIRKALFDASLEASICAWDDG